MKSDYFDFSPNQDIVIENLFKKNHYNNANAKNNLSININVSFLGINCNGVLDYNNYYTSFENTIAAYSFGKTYSNLTPNLSLRKNLDEFNSINIRYSKSYYYPINRHINPYNDYSDTTNIILGNPNLEPSSYKTINMNYTHFSPSAQISASASYSNEQNIIEQVTYQKTISTSITSYKNAASCKRFGMALYGFVNISGFFNIRPWLDWSRREYSGYYTNSTSSSWSAGSTNTLSFKDARLQVSINYFAPEIYVQNKKAAVFTIDAAFKMLFFNKQLTVTARVADLLNTQNINTTTLGKDFTAYNTNRETTRIFSLNISYYFKIKAKEEIEELHDLNDYKDDF
jgi:hypothetical protein